MRTMLTAFAAVLVIAAIAYLALDQMPFSSADRYSDANVRLD